MVTRRVLHVPLGKENAAFGDIYMSIKKCVTLFLAILSFTAVAREPFTLKYQPSLRGVDETILKLDSRDRILVRSESSGAAEVAVLDSSGLFLFALPVPGESVAFYDFAYSEENGVFLVSVRSDGQKMTRVYGADGGFLGLLRAEASSGIWTEACFFRQIIAVGNGGGLFVNTYHPGNAYLDPLIQPVRVEWDDRGPYLERLGAPFSPQLNESRFFKATYFRRYITAWQGGDEVRVVSELESHAWVHAREEKDASFQSKKPLQLPLAHRVSPLGVYRTFQDGLPYKKEELERFYWSFSRVQGYQRLEGTDYAALAYSAPNEVYYEGDETAAPFLLYVVCLDKNFRKVSKEISREGSFFLGAVDKRILLWQAEPVAVEARDANKKRWRIRVDPSIFAETSFFYRLTKNILIEDRKE